MSTLRMRSVLEVGGLAAVIYFFLGAPGIDLQAWTGGTAIQSTSSKTARPESLLLPTADLACPKHEYQTHIFSSSPLIIYIEDFVSDSEIAHLVSSSSDKWRRSTVFNGGVETQDDSVRKSEKALIDRDETVQCIEQRALDFQGWPVDSYIERLWTQRYNISGHYAHHFDWASGTKQARRVSTFMVYLQADCEGGGTEFPRLSRREDARWCQFVECDSSGDGVIFKAKKGSAVFWENFDQNGRGYKDTIHAGMPVTKGTKIGLNIWTWYQAA